ncbi:VOC family protein [Mucilaginibacter pankratovii]|nr:VOC family protein [Mucilaginibacter pankratovii]
MKKVWITAGFMASFALGWAFNLVKQDKAAKKVTGIGGIFFKCKDPQAMRTWYSKNLGLQTDKYGTSFAWYQGADSTKKGFTQWSVFSDKTKYFEPSAKEFMINYRVANLEALLKQLQADGVTITDKMETFDYGKFVHIMDPEGNKIEL